LSYIKENAKKKIKLVTETEAVFNGINNIAKPGGEAEFQDVL
jgi:hypothetical protein